MRYKQEKPLVQKNSNNNWEFIYPESINNEKVYDTFWNAVDLLDNHDLFAEKNLKKLIAMHPYYIDAYSHLSIAFRNQGKDFESLLTAEKAFNLGISCLPKSFDLKKDKLIWSNLGNRPFLRAGLNFGLECHYHKKYSEAVEIYTLILKLNEDDHQGIRYLLLETFFASKDYKQAELLLNRYSDDYSIEFKFGTVALSILQNKLQQVDKYLGDAFLINEFFIDEVIKDKHSKPLPYRIPGEPNLDAGIPIGSAQQAYDYWERNIGLYNNKKIKGYFKTANTLLAK